MVRVQLPTGVVEIPERAFIAEVASKRVPVTAAASLDGGATWTTALEALKQVRGRADEALAAFLPVRVEPYSLFAGYVALLTLFFFGGPITMAGVAFAWDTGPKLPVRLGAVAVALVLGPLPPLFLGWVALRALKKDPSLRGKGRAIFALVVAGLLAVPLLAGLVMIAVR